MTIIIIIIIIIIILMPRLVKSTDFFKRAHRYGLTKHVIVNYAIRQPINCSVILVVVVWYTLTLFALLLPPQRQNDYSCRIQGTAIFFLNAVLNSFKISYIGPKCCLFDYV